MLKVVQNGVIMVLQGFRIRGPYQGTIGPSLEYCTIHLIRILYVIVIGWLVPLLHFRPYLRLLLDKPAIAPPTLAGGRIELC